MTGGDFTPEELVAFLQQKEREIGVIDLTPVLEEAALMVALDVQRSFARAETPGGFKWAPVKKPRGRPLIDTGKMIDAVLRAVKTPDIGKDEIVFDFRGAPHYTLYHQFGTRRMPARPFLGMSKETLDVIAGLLADDAVSFVLGFGEGGSVVAAGRYGR